MKYNIKIKNKRTSITLNPDTVILLLEISDRSLQELVNAAEKKGFSNGPVTASSWVTSLVIAEAIAAHRELKQKSGG